MNDIFSIPAPRQPMARADWLALPEDVMASVFEEIVELREQGRAEQHWAWSFVQSFFENE